VEISKVIVIVINELLPISDHHSLQMNASPKTDLSHFRRQQPGAARVHPHRQTLPQPEPGAVRRQPARQPAAPRALPAHPGRQVAAGARPPRRREVPRCAARAQHARSASVCCASSTCAPASSSRSG